MPEEEEENNTGTCWTSADTATQLNTIKEGQDEWKHKQEKNLQNKTGNKKVKMMMQQKLETQRLKLVVLKQCWPWMTYGYVLSECPSSLVMITKRFVQGLTVTQQVLKWQDMKIL